MNLEKGPNQLGKWANLTWVMDKVKFEIRSNQLDKKSKSNVLNFRNISHT